MDSNTPNEIAGSLPEQLLEDSSEESSTDGGGDPIALLSPVNLPTEEEGAEEEYDTTNLSNLYNAKSDQFIFQTHESTIFEHKLQVGDSDLSELMEKVVITKTDPKYPDMDTVENVLLHTRKMDNLELTIQTVTTLNDEIIDHNLKATVYNIEETSTSSRLMSQDELYKFKTRWRKLWRPNYSDDKLYDYALLETEIQPERNTMYPVESMMPQNGSISKSLQFNSADQIISKRGVGKSKVLNDEYHSKAFRKSSNQKQSSIKNKSRQEVNNMNKTGWETYVDPSEHEK